MTAVAAAILHAVVLFVLAVFFGSLDVPTSGCIAVMGAWTLLEGHTQSGHDSTQDRPSQWLGLVTATVVVVGVTSIHTGTPLGWSWMVAGLVLRIVSVRTLGAAFVTSPQSLTKPVTRGIYGVIRHPSELGLLLLLTGVVWSTGSRWSAGIVVVAALPLVLWRVHREDSWWSTHASAAHAIYVASRPAFFPGFATRLSPEERPK
ncbi:MAG: protein-S-isoprenylcysteine O-methyltransferase Ste14 [Myxococcota bacterium]|jgi:protein-S-isoprenylcysteine O-methyltransferase Ste14